MGYELQIESIEILSQPTAPSPIVINQKLVQAGAEGGANIFSLEYFGQQAYLAQSPQFYKQMMVGVFERVFEIAPVFRAEKHDTSRHLNEYTSVDIEVGYIQSFEELMQLETAMLKYTFTLLNNTYEKELNLLGIALPTIHTIPALSFREANPSETESFDLLFRGLEITTGGQRIHNFEAQIDKMLQRNMNIELFESYLMMPQTMFVN